MENTAMEKTLGTFLLFLGLSIIGYSLYLGINVFVNAQAPPEVFKPVAIATNPAAPPAKTPDVPIPQNLNGINPAEIQKMISNNLISPEMIKSIIPPEMFGYTTRLMNLSIFSIFLWVLITAGAKIASLGISLIKTNSNIKV